MRAQKNAHAFIVQRAGGAERQQLADRWGNGDAVPIRGVIQGDAAEPVGLHRQRGAIPIPPRPTSSGVAPWPGTGVPSKVRDDAPSCLNSGPPVSCMQGSWSACNIPKHSGLSLRYAGRQAARGTPVIGAPRFSLNHCREDGSSRALGGTGRMLKEYVLSFSAFCSAARAQGAAPTRQPANATRRI